MLVITNVPGKRTNFLQIKSDMAFNKFIKWIWSIYDFLI